MKRRKKPKFKRMDLDLGVLEAIIGRTESGPLSAEDREKLKGAVETLAFLTQELEAKGTSIKRLRNLLFGASTEKTSRIAGVATKVKGKAKKKRKGHGRNGAAAYTGAEKVKVPHESLKRGDPCPECHKGKVYPLSDPSVLVRVTGMAPIQAKVYECDRLRCNLCLKVFTAKTPGGVGGKKYDETVAAMIGLLKYGTGLPFNRLEKLQKGFGIPLPAATQWEQVRDAAVPMMPAYAELVHRAAQGKVLHNDDTTAKILELMVQTKDEAMKDDDADERTGMFTTGIVSVGDGHRTALFFTGRKHAGENLEKVLAERAEELGPPIQMCDLLSRNTSGDFETIVAGCMSHSRRRYVDVVDNFPDEVRHVLEELKKVYKNDAVAQKKKMTDEERLAFHQAKSGPVMEKLDEWLTALIEEKKVEPNSGLGEAIDFMQRHWDKLTLFLREPGAPLDNNIVERALKKSIMHRKNSLFYKTQNGARVGDMYMTFIHTSELNGVDPFDYLVALQRHADEVSLNPGDWMPWNYRETMARLSKGPDPPK
jgi:transposase